MKNFLNKRSKMILILAIILIIVICIVYKIIDINKKPTAIEDFETIKQVVDYMGSEYISEEGSTSKIVKLKFKYPLYNEDNTSNENYFNKLINMIAFVINYKDFTLVDDENNINITVQCDRGNNSISKVIINGSSNYFAKSNTDKEIEKFNKTNNIDFSINSNILINVINNNWKYNESTFGTKDSSYAGYDIFFDEGIEVKYVSNTLDESNDNSIFNIIFNSKYSGDIINNLNTMSSLDDVEALLGKPQFGTVDSGLIGYKSNNFYIFFNFKNEISIYRNFDIDKSEISKIIGTFITNRDSERLLSNIVEIWPFYDKFEENGLANSSELVYTLIGIKIKFNVDNEQGIVLYNNFNGNITEGITIDDVITKRQKVPNYVYIKNVDLVYETEEKRSFYSVDTQFMKQTNNFIAYTTKVNDYYNVKFISKNENYPNSELIDSISTYEWLDDNRLVYSRKNIGIYVYNVVTKEKVTLISGNEEFHIEKFENGKLYFDNRQVDIK